MNISFNIRLLVIAGEMSEYQKVCGYVCGLHDYLRVKVKAYDPQTLDEAQTLYKLFENKGRQFLKYIQT